MFLAVSLSFNSAGCFSTHNSHLEHILTNILVKISCQNSHSKLRYRRKRKTRALCLHRKLGDQDDSYGQNKGRHRRHRAISPDVGI